ncbi:MAG: insulinase family protein [Flavipsychrobacter sp.]|nr:insulinase family protein [Flavipsychrobacter sp.]
MNIGLLTRLRRLCGILLITSISGIVAAQDNNTKLPTDPDVTTGKLSSGLTYYIRNNHKPANKVELRLVVKAGSILETNEQLGLAHFMEHMNFNGTKNFEKNALVSYLQSIGVQFGADLNAYTAFDQTVYILPIPMDKPENLEKGFQIIEDWAHNALLTDKDIDDERAVVLEESRLGKGADDRMLKKYFPKLAEGSLYADRLPIGTDEVLKNFKHSEIRNYYTDWYRPDLQAVIIVGDIDIATAKKMLTKHFEGLKNPAGEKERKYVDVVSRKAPEAMVVTDKEATNASLAIMYPYAKKQASVTLGDYKGDLIRNLALAMINRRLNDLAQSSEPPFPFAGVGFDDLIHGYESFNAYTIFSNDPQKAMTAITGELVRANKFGFTESELELARKDMMSGMDKSYNERKTTDSKDYVEEYIRAFLNNEPFPGMENEHNYYKTMVPAITLADVNNEVKDWTKNTNTFTLITAPDKADLKLPDNATLLAMTKKGLAQEVTKTEEKKLATTLLQKKPEPGKVVTTTKEKEFDATTYTLANGIKVTIKTTDFKSDEILMNGVKPGGSNGFGVADRSNLYFATNVIEAMGTGEFSPSDLEKVLAGKEVRVKASIGEITDEVSGSSTVKDFETMLQLTYLTMTQPRRDEGLFNAFKEKQLTMLQYMRSNPQAAFFDTTVKTLYNNSPFAKIIIPTATDFEMLRLDRIIEIYRKEISNANGYHFFITGNIKPETALPLLETYLGSIQVQREPLLFKDNMVRRIDGVKELKIKKGKEKQSLILTVYSGEVKFSEDLLLKARAVAEVLNIKVIEELREKMGGIYTGGFNANVSKEPYESYSIQLQLPCGPENVDKLLAAVKTEIQNLKTSGPSAKDLDKVKSQWKEKYITDVKENKYWAGKMQTVLFWGRDKDRVFNYKSYIDKLTPAEIQATAKELFNGKNQFTSILYPES